MKFEPSITVSPPPYSDQTGKVITPEPVVLEGDLDITYADQPKHKLVRASITRIPTPIILWQNEEYDAAGDWTQAQAEERLLSKLGPDPQSTLQSLFPRTMEQDPNGPGTVLAKMIKSLGIVMSDSCSCRRHAIEMNTKGNDWCSANVDTVVGWLREEATRRGLPFVDMVGRLMVTRAIKKSRKLLANQPVPENDEDLDKDES